MRKNPLSRMTPAWLILTSLLATSPVQAQRQMETLDRGVVAVRQEAEKPL
jgi:hypothetical protein